MTAHALIEEARADGLELRSNGDKLKLLGPAEVVERWKPRIVASKSEIMQALSPLDIELERLIQRAGAFWEYSPDDFVLIYDLARTDPNGLRLALETDIAFSQTNNAAPEITGGNQV